MTHTGMKKCIDDLEHLVEVLRWAAAEAAVVTDGKSCYEVSADM